ncbi:MAG: NRAMP family divalent metal transporter [Chloroflexota bacterium]
MATVTGAVGADIKPWSLKEGTSFVQRAKDLGPGAFVAATFIGSGDIATGGTAGGAFGFGYWWAYWVTCVTAWFCLDVVARYYLVTGKAGVSMFRSIPKIGWFLALFIGLFGVYYGVGNVTSQFSAAGWAITGMFPGVKYEVAAGLVALLCMALVWIGNYGIIDKTMSVMLIAIVASFFAALFATGVNLADAARGMIPAGDPAGGFANNFQAIAGTNINGAAVLLFAYSLKERGNLPDDLKGKVMFLSFARSNALLGSFGAVVVSFALLGVINQVIYPYGIIPRKPEDFAILIEPVAGPWAIPIFSLGVLAATLSSALGNGMIGAYVTCEYFLGKPVQSNNIHFKVVYILNAVIAGGIVLARIDPIFLKTITSMMNASFFGVVGLVLAYWAGSSKLGYFRNGSSVPLWALTVLTIVVASYVGIFNLGGYFGLKF